ncbi:phosphoglucomutase/phosphomannomutase family protein [bacterium]
MVIKFGTSGWRAIIADEFTYQNVGIVSQAIADYLNKTRMKSKEIVVGYDTRFMSFDFAKHSSQVLAANGFVALLSDESVPTPTISYEIIRRKACGGINITASHNPPEYNGIKFSPSWGGPALPETTKKIELNCNIISKNSKKVKIIDFDEAVKKKKIKVLSFKKAYLNRLSQLVDMEVIKKSKIKVAVDVMNGAGIGYFNELFDKYKINYQLFNTNRDCMFGGHHPEPNKEHLSEIANLVKKKKFDIGIATDGDADRFGIIDKDGSFITPNEIIAVLLNHLVKTRKWKGICARSVMTTSLIDAVAKKWNVKLKETPVGFKYIGDILINEPFIVGGEESGGLSIRGHVPEKDGLIACLLAVEVMAIEKKSIKQILKELYKEVGYYETARENFRLNKKQMHALKKRLKGEKPQTLAGKKVTEVVTLDGYKFVLESGEWIGIRLSGTEPVVRCYVDAHSNAGMKKLLNAGKKLVFGK